MDRRVVTLMSALMLTVACDGAKTDAKKSEPSKAEVSAKAEKAKAEKTDAKLADAKKADAEKADAEKADAEDDAKKAEERKARVAKAMAELDQWKTEEKTRWTEEIESGVKTLVEAKYEDLKAAAAAVMASPHRVPANVERDQYRHPAETLEFFGLRPDMTVVEVGPGGGWYTELLAPMLASGGLLKVTDSDPNGPEDQGSTLYARRFQAFMERSPSAYGKFERIVQKDGEALDLGPAGSADMVLVIRGLHGWLNRGTFDANVAKVHAALKPGGIAAVVQHRAAEDAKTEDSAKKGYLPQAWVVQQFEAGGFTLEEASELNANPNDTKDYEEGVWTLPPTLALGDKDRDKYAGIGESDRMTLRFRKK